MKTILEKKKKFILQKFNIGRKTIFKNRLFTLPFPSLISYNLIGSSILAQEEKYPQNPTSLVFLTRC